MSKKIWLLSEIFYPEETSTAYILTKISEGLKKKFDVNVICTQPRYDKRGKYFKNIESYRGIKIIRIYGTTFNKDHFGGRLINIFTFSFSILVRGLFLIEKGDKILAVTNPPILPFIAAVISKLRGASLFILIHDIYPDLIIEVKRPKIKFPFIIWKYFNKTVFRIARIVFVLGRDMKERLNRDYGISLEKIVIASNWADIDEVFPQEKGIQALIKKLNLMDKFIVLYAGNIGVPNDIETIVQAAEILKHDREIHFLFIGSGAKKTWLMHKVVENALENITILNALPRLYQNSFLNSADVCLICLKKGMKGISVPSRTYNIMASGKPIIAIVEEGSEVAYIVKEYKIGWIIKPGNYVGIVKSIDFAKNNPLILKEMGARARTAAEKYFTFENTIKQLIENLSID